MGTVLTHIEMIAESGVDLQVVAKKVQERTDQLFRHINRGRKLLKIIQTQTVEDRNGIHHIVISIIYTEECV